MPDEDKSKQELVEELSFLRQEVAELKTALASRKGEESELFDNSFRKFFLKNDLVMLLIDPEDGTITEANTAALRFYGYSRQELLQKRIQDINTLAPQEVARELERANSGLQSHFSFRHRLKGGEIRDVEVYRQPIEVHGRALLFSIIHDVSDQKRAEKELRKSEERYHRLFEDDLTGDSSDAGMWEWDLRTNRNLWSEELWRLYGLKPHSCEPSYDSWRATIHPDDRKMAEQTVQEAAVNGTAISSEYRVPEDLPSFSKDLYLS
jgi:PAS domain S-box-containing protein